MSDRFLIAGGLMAAIVSLLHFAVILGGPEWYRFFGAGERMARLAARGDLYPKLVTAAIAAILGVWALYGFSGAGVIRPLPFSRPVLWLVSAVFLGRGVLGIPLVWLVEHPYTLELRARMTFMVVTSVICLALGLCYAFGAARS